MSKPGGPRVRAFDVLLAQTVRRQLTAAGGPSVWDDVSDPEWGSARDARIVSIEDESGDEPARLDIPME